MPSVTQSALQFNSIIKYTNTYTKKKRQLNNNTLLKHLYKA